jgi:cleavage and polyadenylation specificity factor subunit 2
VGGLPFVYGQLGLTCPILGTVPVHHLGLVTLYDAYQSYCLSKGSAPAEEDGITLDHIDKAFEHMTMLRYAQPFHLANTGLVISALPAGHSVGGAIWRLTKGNDTSILYAPAFNHKREAHLDGAPFELISKPTLVITSAESALQVPVARKARDDALLDGIGGALRAGGNVLIPVETAGRTLEMLQLLNSNAETLKRKQCRSLVLLSHQARRTVELAKGMLEWMGQAMMRVFEEDRTNPFELGGFKLCHSLEELAALPEPKVVLASLESLEIGLARSLFVSWAAQAKSLILFPRQPAPGSLAHSVLAGGKITVRIFERVPLERAELDALRRAQEEERERKNAERAFAELKRRLQAEQEEVGGMLDEDESDDEVENSAGVDANVDLVDSAKALREIYWTDYRTDWFVDLQSPLHTSYVDSVESPHWPLIGAAKGNHSNLYLSTTTRFHQFPMHHHSQQHRRIDSYGEAVDPADFGGPAKDEEVEAARPSAASANESKAPEAVPTKLIDYSREVSVRCGRKVLDFAGLADGRSLKTILAQMAPRRLILAGGTAPATDYLQQHLLFTADAAMTEDAREDSGAFECWAPQPLETLRIAMASNTRQAVLAEALIDGLEVGLLKDLELAFVQAQVSYGDDKMMMMTTTTTTMMMDVDEGNEDNEGVSDELTTTTAAAAAANPERVMTLLPAPAVRRDPLMVGELRLGELRLQISQALGLPAEFASGGDLICGNGPALVRLRKEGEALALEGSPASEDYYRIRDLLYSQVAII